MIIHDTTLGCIVRNWVHLSHCGNASKIGQPIVMVDTSVPYDSKLRPLLDLIIETEFLTMANASLGETWSARIRGKPLSQRPVLASLIVYLFNEGRGEMAYHLSGQRSLEEVFGHTPEVFVIL